MPSSLPVPSKAALTALRGLVLGTSCSIALIAEDRRRRINNALRVIENSEKIKSARGYRPGGGALAVALEEEAVLWDPGLLSLTPGTLELHQHNTEATSSPTRKSKGKSTKPIDLDGVENVVESSPGKLTASDPVVVSEPSEASKTHAQASHPKKTSKPAKKAKSVIPQDVPKLRKTPRQVVPSWLSTNAEVLKSFSFPTNDEIVAKVHAACETADPLQIGIALRFVFEALDEKIAPDNQDRPWIEATARLCRTCQETGRIEDAVKLLSRVLARGPLEESVYLDHGPLVLIDTLLAQAESNELPREAYLKNLDAAINLFLPTFTEKPTGPNPEIYDLGWRLMDLSFSADRLQRIIGMYRRCNLIAGADSDDLTSWFLTKMYEKHEYKSVVKVFCSTYAKSSPNQYSIHGIGDTIVHSVESAHNYRPAEVLKALHSCCGLANTKLNSQWVMKLLNAHWTKHRNFEEIEALFALLRTPHLEDNVARPDNIFRVMIDFALEAGEEAKAESYFRDAIEHNPALAYNTRFLGVFARFEARNGDWEAVRARFENMQDGDDQAFGQVFVPVLKAYAEGHTVSETEEFLKSYVDELRVPLSSFMVTLMAKRYGAVRDVYALLDWLHYCGQAGFKIDAAFTNAILMRCRKEWRLPFRELRTLFRKIRVLNPDFVDGHTERIMADAALTDSKHGGKAAQGRLLSLRIDSKKLPARGKCSPTEDVALGMKEALTCGRPRAALHMYKRALHLGMKPSEHALRLAVQALLNSVPNSYEGAYSLIRDAETKDVDVKKSVIYLLGLQLADITTTTDRDEALETVKRTLAQFEAAGIALTETILHRAAVTCLNAGHFQGAVSYALKAVEVRGPPAGPCFNLHNFKILLAAYTELVDPAGIRDTIKRGLASTYREDSKCREALKHARARVMQSRASNASPQQRFSAREAVNEGIRMVVEARKALRREGKLLEKQAIQIMRQAAADAGCAPVYFDEVPWLGGGKNKGKKKGDGAVGKGEGKGEGGDDPFQALHEYEEMEREASQRMAKAVAAF